MKNYNLFNYGYLEDKISSNLHSKLLEEAYYLKSNAKEYVSGVSDTGVARHYKLVNHKKELFDYIITMMQKYNDIYPSILNIKYFTSHLPLHFNVPWINFQKKGEFIPNHTHDGIYSYNIWLKSPTKNIFEFNYTSVLGDIMQHKIEVTKEKEGTIIFFPAKLMHTSYPFNDSDDDRISLSGNIVFKT